MAPRARDSRQNRTTVATEGGEAPADGQPRASDLPWPTRLVLHGSTVADLGLRTAVASLVSVPIASWVASGDLREDRRHYRFYRDLAEARDPSLSFPAPRPGTVVTALRPPPLSFRAPGGRVELLRFDSRFVPVNRAMRRRYRRFSRNGTAWAQHWRHDDGPRPTLCVIHGFMASPYWFNSAFFALPWLYGRGYDVLLYVLPFHGLRRGRLAPFNGWGLFAHGLAHMNEALAQAVHDLRVFLDHLQAGGVEKVGVTGLSLGGYVTALMAAVDERVHVAIPNAAVTSIGHLARQWFPVNLLLGASPSLVGIPFEEIERALAFHSPLNYEPLVPRDRRMIIGGLGDRLAPPEQSRMLWEHWGRCRLHWYPGNHALHVNRGAYLKEMRQFMRAAGFEG